MNKKKTRLIRFGLDCLNALGAFRLMSPWTRGRGVIFTLHHVRPPSHEPFRPNRLLEVSPEFLERTVTLVRRAGFEIVPLDQVAERLKSGGSKRFAAFTFDDGYLDNLEYAYPVMKRLDAPFTIYVATSMPDRSAELWWRALETVIRNSDGVDVTLDGTRQFLRTETTDEKYDAYERIYWWLRQEPEDAKRSFVRDLAARHGIDLTADSTAMALSWEQISELAADPLVTIGAHTVTHPSLAQVSPARAEREMREGVDILACHLDEPPRHFAYPYGSCADAGAREFDLAEQLAFDTAVTTRPGVLYGAHRAHLHALPRVSLNGEYQAERFVRMFLSGAPFVLWNGFRRLNVA